jgi:hypothetical protein
LPIAKAETIQVEIIEIRGPDAGHANLFGCLGGNREECVTPPNDVLAFVYLDPLKPLRIAYGIVEDVGVGNEQSPAVAEVFFGFAGETTVCRAHFS